MEKSSHEDAPFAAVQLLAPTKSYAHIPVIMRKPPVAQVQISQELIEDYATKIRVAREKLGLTHEDLGKKINEKASY